MFPYRRNTQEVMSPALKGKNGHDRQKRSNSYPTATGFNAEQRKRNLPSVYYQNERNVKEPKYLKTEAHVATPCDAAAQRVKGSRRLLQGQDCRSEVYSPAMDPPSCGCKPRRQALDKNSSNVSISSSRWRARLTCACRVQGSKSTERCLCTVDPLSCANRAQSCAAGCLAEPEHRPPSRRGSPPAAAPRSSGK